MRRQLREDLVLLLRRGLGTGGVEVTLLDATSGTLSDLGLSLAIRASFGSGGGVDVGPGGFVVGRTDVAIVLVLLVVRYRLGVLVEVG